MRRRYARVVPFSGWRRRMGGRGVGFDVRVGEDPGAVFREVKLRLDREGRAVAAGGKLLDDLAVVDGQGDCARGGSPGRWEGSRSLPARSGR